MLLVGPITHAAEPAVPDQAVDRALLFLSRTQDPDGAWRVGGGKNAAVTSLAVMAFLSAGHVPGAGPYAEHVDKGIRWVIGIQKPNGLMATEGHHEMYHHGICTLMLSEVVGMTDAKLAAEIRPRLVKAVRVVLEAQRKERGPNHGGWRYQIHGRDSDISVTGWQLMALRAARNVGCDVPAERIDWAVDYIKRCQDTVSGGFRYGPWGGVTTACTGTSVLGLELSGRDRHHTPEALRAGNYLIKEQNLPRWGSGHFFYSIYYCSQAMFQLGDNYWNFFRPRLHQVLLNNQASNGSWLGGDGIGANYGTAMGVLALTVEYRFLPIYQRGDEPLQGGN
jgi:hypothetical protein